MGDTSTIKSACTPAKGSGDKDEADDQEMIVKQWGDKDGNSVTWINNNTGEAVQCSNVLVEAWSSICLHSHPKTSAMTPPPVTETATQVPVFPPTPLTKIFRGYSVLPPTPTTVLPAPSPPHNSPTKLHCFLRDLEESGTIPHATCHLQALVDKSYGPDILHLVNQKELEGLGIKSGDAI
ncbi:hypothetical protein GYMLUDRAFT_63245 [Collybiopsis luxurians FD-317 M1]|uniref:SAM domain-containing protein n=1 Tax=Collybiopsis luxurians FD-317 M1 TaxID=944289 RepID=A0A0D0BX10_9AGAR|nr:hypothetical protein GYMLUDRAFT_63245 [Collybiopsis luxurians FD-317 M1]